MVDLLKSKGITALFTSLRTAASEHGGTDQALSSLMDSWIKLDDIEANGERNRVLYIIKSRGSSHSNQIREYRMTDRGIELIEPYIGAEGVLTGTARITQEAREAAALTRRQQEISQRNRELVRRRAAIERQIAELQATLEVERGEAQTLLDEYAAQELVLASNRSAIATRRGAAE
jgi:circadian clock protein KaiC